MNMSHTPEEERHIFIAFFRLNFRKIFMIFMYALAVALLEGYTKIRFSLPFLSIATAGTALAMITAFRFKITYDRWLEARTLWQQLVTLVRTFARLTDCFYEMNAHHVEQKALAQRHLRSIYYILASFPYAVHFVLSSHLDVPGDTIISPSKVRFLQRFIDRRYHAMLEGGRNVPLLTLKALGSEINELAKLKAMEEVQQRTLHTTINFFEELLGHCEKLKSSRLPMRYRYLFNILIITFSLGLPWCLTGQIGFLSCLFTVVNYTLFLVFEDLGQRTEVPFGTRRHDIRTLHYARIVRKFVKAHYIDDLASL